MPRSPENNPTERIGRILDEVEELEAYAQALVDLLPGDLIDKTPRFPYLTAITQERAWRHRFLGQTLANRKAQRRTRARDENVRSRVQYKPTMDQDIEVGLSDRTKEELAKLLGEEK